MSERRPPTSDAVTQALSILLASWEAENGIDLTDHEHSQMETVAAADDQIAAVAHSLAQLQAEATRRLGPLLKQRNSLLPFHTLPMELHSHIVALAAQGKHPTKRLASFAAVSSHWWQVIRNSPHLWAYIQFPCSSWEYSLRQSKNAPLHIMIKGSSAQYEPGFDDFLTKATSQADRWRSIRIPGESLAPFIPTVERSLPSLEMMEINDSQANPHRLKIGGGPSLRRLRVRHAAISWEQAILSGLEDLSLGSMEVGVYWGLQLRGILATCEKLRRLRLVEIQLSSNSSQPTNPHTSLPPDAAPLLLPRLCNIHIDNVSEMVLIPILPFEASAQINNLHIHDSGTLATRRILESLAGRNSGDGLFHRYLQNCRPPDITVEVDTSTSRIGLFDIGSSIGGLDISMSMKDWQTGLENMSSLLKDVAPHVNIQITGTKIRFMTDLSLMEDIPRLQGLIIDNHVLAVPILAFLAKEAGNLSTPSYPCPSLQSVKIGFNAHFGRQPNVIRLMEKLKAARPGLGVLNAEGESMVEDLESH